MAKRGELSPTQREAIRAIYDDNYEGIHGRTIKSLENRGLVFRVDLEWVLTEKGMAEHSKIMSSGNGPEALKELFRFINP